MVQSYGTKQPTNDKLVYLRQQQKQCREGSSAWHEIQSKINRIIAQNYLEYVNT